MNKHKATRTQIEVKYLVRKRIPFDHLGEPTATRQGYLSSDKVERSIRVRWQQLGSEQPKGYLGVKGKALGAWSKEWEYEIPAEDAAQMLELVALRPLVEKTRRFIQIMDVKWDVDEYHGDNEGLVTAEAEYVGDELVDNPSTWEPADKPAWVGQKVQGVSRYFNNRLIDRPYKDWPEEYKTQDDGSVSEAVPDV
jgi:adenylate cyclase